MSMWILVAHRSGARLLERGQDDEEPRIIETIDHPEGRLKDGELVTDGRGQTFESAGPGRRAKEPGESPKSQVANSFAKELAEKLEAGRNDDRYQELILVAAPRFLGMLRGALDEPTARMVAGTYDKDYAEMSDHELVETVTGLLPS